MQRIFKFRKMTLLFFAAILCFPFLLLPPQNEPMYRGRTVEQWLCSSDWTTRQQYVAVIIMDFEDRAVAPLEKILLRKGSATEEALLANLPFARMLKGSRMTIVEKKERVITSLESLGMTALKCIPTLVKVAQNQGEPLRVRQLAIRRLSRMSASGPTKEALTALINDLHVGAEAAQALAEIKQRQEASEISQVLHKIREEDIRSDDLITRTSLWESAEPTVRWNH
jgi:hypothetical protein